MNLATSRNLSLKNILLVLTVILLAYQLGKSVLVLNTFSLSTWMITFIKTGILIIPIYIIVQWDVFINIVRAGSIWNFHKPNNYPYRRYLIPVMFYAIVGGFIASVLITRFPMHSFVGQSIILGSMLCFLFLGLVKLDLVPVSFLIIFPFVSFAAARLRETGDVVDLVTSNASEWINSIFFSGSLGEMIFIPCVLAGLIYFMVNKDLRNIKSTINIPIALFLLWTLLSVFMAKNPLHGTGMYIIKWILPFAMFYFTLIAVRRNEGIRELTIGLILFFFMILLFSLQHAALGSELLKSIGTGERAKQWTVIGGQVGPWVVIILPITISVLMTHKESIVIRLFAGSTILLSLIMIIWEMQRGVFLTLGALLVVYIFIYKGKLKRNLILIALFCGMVYLFSDELRDVIYLFRPQLLEKNPYSLIANLDRVLLLQSGFEIGMNNLLFGVGPGGFELLGIGLYGVESSTHNVLLEIFVESGIFATALFLVILLIPLIKNIIYTFRHQDFDNFDPRPYILSLGGFFVYSMISGIWIWEYGIVVMIIVAILESVGHPEADQA